MSIAYGCQIEEVVQSIFSSMLDMNVCRDDNALTISNRLLSTIQIAGPEPRIIVLGLTADTARNLAAAMLQMETAELSDTDLTDVAAELVNMIGGNLKSLSSGPSTLTLPAVAAGENVGMKIPGAELIEETGLSCEGGALCVRVFAPTANCEVLLR